VGLHLSVLSQLQQSGQWAKYQSLVAAADGAAYDSPAVRTLLAFEQGWQANPTRAASEGIVDFFIPQSWALDCFELDWNQATGGAPWVNPGA
jgi:hypothetical protein